jgi:hypothetical protein
MGRHPTVEAALREYRALLAVALTRTGDPPAARRLVEAYFRGRLQDEQRERTTDRQEG